MNEDNNTMTTNILDHLILAAVELMNAHVRDGELQLGYAAQTSNLQQRAEMCLKAAAAFERANGTNMILQRLFTQRRSN